MPNWCKGTIKFRGTKEAIINVMLKGLIAVNGERPNISFDEKYSGINSLCFSVENICTFWLDNTYRMFVDLGDESDEYYAYKRKGGNEFIIALPFRAAWGIHASTYMKDDGLNSFAKKYNIDIRASGFERGMGFDQTVEVNRDGKVILNVENNYGNDYERFVWECAMPNMGG